MPQNIKNSAEYKRLQKLTDEKNHHPKIRKKRRRKRYGCLMFFRCSCFILFWLIIILIVSAALAKSGLVKVPFLSDLLHSEPFSIENVNGEPTDAPTENLELPKINVVAGEFSIILTDDELTNLANLSTGQSQDPSYSQIKITISTESINVSGQLLKPFKSAFSVDLVPKIIDNKVSLNLLKFKIGIIGIPSFIVNELVNNLLSDNITKLNEQIGENVTLEKIILQRGTITISGTKE